MSQPNPTLFRKEALKHYLQAEEGRGLVKVSPPWTWTLLWILLAALGAGLLGSFLGHVDSWLNQSSVTLTVTIIMRFI